MPPVTRGRLLVTPATLNTKASLAQLAAAMNEDRLPRGSVLNAGWGALTDDETRVGLTGPVPFRGGEAVVVVGHDVLAFTAREVEGAIRFQFVEAGEPAVGQP